MSKIKATCHVCNYTFKSELPPQFCAYCGTDLLDPSNESALRKPLFIEYGGWNGSLILTNKRLMFVKLAKSGKIGGIVGGVVDAIATLSAQGERLGLSIPHGTIQTADIVKKAFGHTLIIRVNDGSQYNLPIPKKQIEELKDAILKFNL